MRPVQILLIACLVSSHASYHRRAAFKKNSRSLIETPESSTETPDTSPETPNSETETPDTPDTPNTTPDIPDTPETPDTKAVVPNSANTPHSSETDMNDDISEPSDNDFPGHVHESSPVLGKKTKHVKKHHAKIDANAKQGSRLRHAKHDDLKGTKKQLLGIPEPDGREATAYDDFGQGGPPAPGYGGLSRGGLGSEIEGMAVGMGGGGEPLGFNDQGGPPAPNFHIPGISGPSNYEENAEVGRGNDDDSILSRFGEKEDVNAIAQRAVAPYDSYDDNEGQFEKDNLQQIEPDESVTKAIGRPFDPQGFPTNMDEHEDSPFQNVKQENPFQVPLHSIADQASFAESQMQKFRPETAPQLGPQEDESSFQPQGSREDEAAGLQGYDGQEGGNVQATTMNGAEAVMGMSEQGGISDQGGMKRHKTRLSGRRALLKPVKRKGISRKAQLRKNNS